MDLKLDNLENLLNFDSPNNPLKTLLSHRNELLNSLKSELYYSNLEYKFIDYLLKQNSNSYEESLLDSYNEDVKHTTLLKFDSKEYHDTQNDWKNTLDSTFNYIKESLKGKFDLSKSNAQLDEVQKELSKLQNAYFNAVQEREKNTKLLLRLKMYTSNRLKSLENSLNDFESMLQYKSLYNEPQAKLIDNTEQKEYSNNLDSQYKLVIKAHVENQMKTVLLNNSVEFGSKPKPVKRTTHLVPLFRSMYSHNLLNVFSLTNSLDEFKHSAKVIYERYGTPFMTFKVFNNVVLFLVQSLHLPSLNKIPTEYIYTVYNVNQTSLLDFRTFTLLYWEVLHCLRTAVELHYQPQFTFHPNDLFLNQFVDNTYPFVNISDYYSFIKRLSPGKSCNKYVAKELSTKELRVVELFCKTPDLPLFDEIYSEFEHLKNLDHKNLVKYVALYHDYNTVYVVSEFCSELSLLNKLNSLESSNFEYSLAFVHNVLTQLVESLVYLHCNNVTHNCLSLDKVMIDDSSSLPRVKVRDYGLTDVFETYKYESFLTRVHKAPEAEEGSVTQKSNVWSAGVMLFFMITGQLPSPDVKKTAFVDNLRNYMSNSNLFNVTHDLVDLVTYLLNYDPGLRPTAFDVVSHPWFLSTNVSKVPATTRHLSRYSNSLLNSNKHRNVCKFLENNHLFYGNRLKKVLNTLYLSSELNDPDLVSYGNFFKTLKLENVSNGLVSELVHLTSLKDSDKCSIKEFSVACKLWTLGELNVLWSVCKKSIDNNDWSFNKTEFVEYLYESKTSLLMKEEVNGFCRSISVNDKIYWNHFINFFM